MHSYRLTGVLLGLALALSIATHVAAHQPFFEDEDYTLSQPRKIDNAQVSTALYATLEDPTDVDYFTFTGKKGEQVLVRVDIPQVAGLEQFAPSVALVGPGLKNPQVISPPAGGPPTFYEPFTRTSYWTRQEQKVTLPASGTYQLSVYHPEGQSGRYVLSVGEQEVPGGDPQFMDKLRRFFQPLDSTGQRS